MAWGRLGNADKRDDYYRRALAKPGSAKTAALLALRTEIGTEAARAMKQ